MSLVHDVMIRKLKEHTALSAEESAGLRSLPAQRREAASGEELVRQGDRPDVSMVVIRGMVARYHTLGSGTRQYLSFHIAGDWPDAQTLFIEKMDHAISAVNNAEVALIPHRNLLALFDRIPSVGFAIWRETLVDAAIFREAITNNCSREISSRLAHFLCEQYYRAQAAGLLENGFCAFPLSQTQIGEALGASLTTINRAMQKLRRMGFFELQGGWLHIKKWKSLADYGEFTPSYLHLRRAREPLGHR